MGRLTPDWGDQKGGTAVLDRPAPPSPIEREKDDVGGMISFGRTVGVIVTSTATVGDHTVQGEVEPRHDSQYERQEIRLRRGDAGYPVNANDIQFKCSIQWPGPLVKFLLFDASNKAIGQCVVKPPVAIEANHTVEIGEGTISFVPITPKKGGT